MHYLWDKIDKRIQKRIEENTILDWFDNAAEFAAEADRLVPARSIYRSSNDRSWYGDDDWSASVRNVQIGWPHIVDKAEKIIEQIEREGLLSQGFKGFTQSVAGIFPNVPAAIIGAPESMFDRSESKTEQSAIRVFVDMSVSAIVKTDALVSRGTAIVAFVLGLATKRPVELYTFAGLDGYKRNAGMRSMEGYNLGFASPVVRIETRPADLAAISYCLASPGFFRRLTMGYAELHGYAGAWAYGLYPNENDTARANALRAALDMEPQDVLIPAELLGGRITKDPVGWVRDALTEHIIEQTSNEE
jgi:hypothetical protein